MQVHPIDLKHAKLNQLGQVPLIQYIDLFNRLFRIFGAAVFAGIGTGSVAIGISVLFGLSVVLSAIDNAKS